jgi:adenylyltransferase/sulfurtransferase
MRDSATWSVDYSSTEHTGIARSKVGSLKTVVVGAGALGNEVTQALGLLGCGEVFIVDPDVIERHNLTRSVLFRTEEAIGGNKAVILAAGCQHYFPETLWTAMPTEIADSGLERIAESDIIFSCVDSDLARLEIAYLGTKLDLPVCDAGLGVENYTTARVSFFPGRRSASFCCMLPPARRRELLTMWDCRSFPCWAGIDPTTAWPGTPTAAAIAGSIQVETGIRLLWELRCGLSPSAQSIELVLGDTPQLASFRIPIGSGCPFHEEIPANYVLQAANSNITVRQLLGLAARGRSGDPVLVLDWPLCVGARCRVCGSQWPVMRRLAGFRRAGACPACLSKRLVIERSVHQIDLGSDLADHSLQSLGLPDRHLYTIEFLGGAAQ